MEGIPNQKESVEDKKNKLIEQIKTHAVELSEQSESMPFVGINDESYANIKAYEEMIPNPTTPIDELIARFRAEGMRVVLGGDPTGGNVMIVPWGSADVDGDSLLPRNLNISEDVMMDVRLKELILKTQEYKQSLT